MIRKFTRVYFSLLFCLFINHLAFGQGYQKAWDKTFGGNNSDILLTTLPIKDGGYLMAGTSNSNDGDSKTSSNKGIQDFWVVKTDANGTKDWDKTFGGAAYDFLQTAIQTPDGGFILAGTSNSPVSGDKTMTASSQYDYWIVKINAAGEKLWDKSFGGTGQDHLKSICPTADGGYLLAGSSNSPVSGRASYSKTSGSRGEQDYWLVKINATGTKQWDKTFGGSNYDYLQTVLPTPDNGFILAGHSYSPAGGDKSDGSNAYSDYWVVKLDDAGNKQWDKTYGGDQDETLKTCLVTSDGGFLLAGNSNSLAAKDKSTDSNGLNDFWIVKTDAHGNKQWDKSYGGRGNDYLQAITPIANSGFLVGGTSKSPASGSKTSQLKGEADFWILKINASGNKLWEKTYGGEGYDNLQAIHMTNNGNCMVSGTSTSYSDNDKSAPNRGESDFWLLQLMPGDQDEPDVPEDPVPEQLVKSFTLLNADTDSDIQTLHDNAIINLASLPTVNFNIRANTSTHAVSLVFRLSGTQNMERSEADAPYIVFGASGADYYNWNFAPGNYTLEAIPTSNNQQGASLKVNFEVIDQASGNQTPEANAGANTIINLPDNSITLNGSGSDPDGNITEYQWAQISGPNTATFNNKEMAQPTVSNLVAGIYIFSLKVKDNENATSSADQVTITVNNNSNPEQPIQNFTLLNADTDTELFVLTDNTVLNLNTLSTQNLNIRAKTSTNSISIAFKLTGAQILSRSESGAPYSVFGDSNGDYKSWDPVPGNYTLEATPSYNGQPGIPLVINFRVINQSTSNQIPVANAGADIPINLPNKSLTLKGSGSDPDGNITEYLWSQVSGPNVATFNSKEMAQPTINNLVAGTYIFSLVVKDNENALSAVSEVKIKVNNSPNADQSILSFTLLNADTDEELFVLNDNAILNLSSLPTNNLNIRANTSTTSISLNFRLTGAQTLTRAEGGAPYSVFGDSNGDYKSWIPVLGDYKLEATPAINGVAGTPLVVNFRVISQASQNEIPIASAGSDVNINLPTSSVKLNGTGSDKDGTITKYQWTQVSGPNTANFNSKLVAQPSISNLIAGTYVFRFIVTDNKNAVSLADQVEVTVNSNNNTTQQVISYTLMNADTDSEIMNIADGAVINLSNLPTRNLNIRANTNPGKVGSLVYALSGAYTINKSETAAPYALFGDEAGDFKPIALKAGVYNLKATPYTLAGGTGTAGTPLAINFTLTRPAASESNSDSSYVYNDADLEEEPWDIYASDFVPAPVVELTNYPNPFQEQTTLQFSFAEEQEYTLEIYNLKGISISEPRRGIALAGETVTEIYEMSQEATGIYLVKLITQQEVQHLQIVRGD